MSKVRFFAIPLHAMAENFELVSKSMSPKLGRKSYFTPEAGQGSDEVDGNPVHLLRHPHGKRCAAGRQNRAESTAGGCLKREHAHRKVLSRGNYASVIENGQKIRPKRPE